MRCLSCNVILSDAEACRRETNSGEFLDLCNHCYKHVEEDIPTTTPARLVQECDMPLDDDESLDYDE